ncbi:hypothetical protein BD779DRAFT_1679018 [Infundibulicybe gibba]|nr:hypothetical protein BD779DRAFT_1679018 [Infundibulicybe gibba]
MPKLSHYGIEHADHSDDSSKSTLNGSFSGSTIHQQPTDGQNTGRPEPEQGKNENGESLECGCTMKGRALVVCLDGTSNQFGKNNTNVIELYHRIVKNKKQLTYYNSGIGTYAKPSWRSLPYWKQVISNKIDTAIAWNFEKILLGAYRWLSTNYEEGDRVYLFGFSRGAYQVRALAAMIEKVGLILPGNEEQIHLRMNFMRITTAASMRTQSSNANKTFDMAKRFKESFSRSTKGYRIIYWTGSIEIIALDRYMWHFCYMRHALALDERRVKFQPEYARVANRGSKERSSRVTGQAEITTPSERGLVAGSHSDIGGGVKSNTELNNAAIPACDFTLQTRDHRTRSEDSRFSCFRGRRVPSKGEVPKDASKEQWDNIVGKGNRWSLEWAHDLGDLLELDLFDHSSISDIMDRLNDGQSHARVERLERLAFMARNDGGPEAITGHPQFEMLFDLLRDKDASTKIATCGVLEALAWWSSSRKPLTDDQFNSFFNLLDDRETSVKIATCKILMMMAVLSYSRFTSDQIGALFNLLDDKDAGVKVITCRILGMLAHRGYSRFTNVQFSTLFNLLGDANGDAGVKITICSILEVLATQGHLFGNDVTPIIYRLIVGSNEKLQIAALKTLGGFQLNDVPPEVLAKIHGLVAPMLMDGTKEEDRLSATMALYSCIRECMASIQDLPVFGAL